MWFLLILVIDMPKKTKPILSKYEKYTKQEREAEMNKVKTQLYTFGFDNSIEDFKTMFQIIDNYIETGDPVSGALKLTGYEREFLYLFPETKKHKVQCMLKYVKNV